MMKRKYTVGVKPGYMDNKTPEIRIGGKWLSKVGINVGDQVELSVDERLIIISPATDDEDMSEATDEPLAIELHDTQFPSSMKVTDIVNSFPLRCG
jgi:hypothetical protein